MYTLEQLQARYDELAGQCAKGDLLLRAIPETSDELPRARAAQQALRDTKLAVSIALTKARQAKEVQDRAEADAARRAMESAKDGDREAIRQANAIREQERIASEAQARAAEEAARQQAEQEKLKQAMEPATV